MQRNNMPGSGRRAGDEWIPVGAVAITLAFRVLYFAQIRENPFFDTLLMDEAYHDLWARELAAGKPPRRSSNCQLPAVLLAPPVT